MTLTLLTFFEGRLFQHYLTPPSTAGKMRYEIFTRSDVAVLRQLTSNLRMGTDKERGSGIMRALDVGEKIKVSEAFLDLKHSETELTPMAGQRSNRQINKVRKT
jgi:hypothetical protein